LADLVVLAGLVVLIVFSVVVVVIQADVVVNHVEDAHKI
jgi:hypothetical protein